MELMTLDSSFQPDRLVENFESLIWTERYSQAGDFEIVSGDIDGMMKLLPRETCLCLRNSNVPMLIENHKITKGPRQAPQISITGRSFETVLERRASVRSTIGSTLTEWLMAADSESDAAFRMMRFVLGDLPQYQNGIQILSLRDPIVSLLDAIPQISLVLPNDYMTSAWSASLNYNYLDMVGSGTTIYQATALTGNLNKPPASSPTYWTVVSTGHPGIWGDSRIINIEAADLYTTVLNLCAANFHGIKAIRPMPGGSQIGIEIYEGTDRRNDVVFDARFDQIDSSTYLLTEQGSTNVAYVYGKTGSGSDRVLKNATDATHPEPSGLARRVLLVDATSDDTVTSADNRQSRGLVELYQHNVIAMVDGEVSEQVGAGFNHDYFLGDILLLVADYGLTRNVRVSEFIRTSDDKGEKAYPAFEAVE